MKLVIEINLDVVAGVVPLQESITEALYVLTKYNTSCLLPSPPAIQQGALMDSAGNAIGSARIKP